LVNRLVEAGKRPNSAAGRIGRTTNPPPQLGQTPPNRSSAQVAQNVHSKLQMRAAGLSGGKSTSQHSQLGRNSSMTFPSDLGECALTAPPNPP
jgi:hypothetical protein